MINGDEKIVEGDLFTSTGCGIIYDEVFYEFANKYTSEKFYDSSVNFVTSINQDDNKKFIFVYLGVVVKLAFGCVSSPDNEPIIKKFRKFFVPELQKIVWVSSHSYAHNLTLVKTNNAD